MLRGPCHQSLVPSSMASIELADISTLCLFEGSLPVMLEERCGETSVTPRLPTSPPPPPVGWLEPSSSACDPGRFSKLGDGEANSNPPAPLGSPTLAQCPVLCQGSERSVSPPVENLRHLILWSLLPGHPVEPPAAREPEDDLTPTPSVVSITSHPWDPGSPGQAPPERGGDHPQLPGPEQEDVALSSLEHLPPRARNSGIWESPKLDRNPEEEPPSTEAAGSYKVVRKGKISWGVQWGDKHPVSLG